MTTDSTPSAARPDPPSHADRAPDAPTIATPRRRRRVPVRLVLLIAALFAVLAVLGGGTGLVLGTIAASVGEHQHHESSLYERHGPGLSDDANG